MRATVGKSHTLQTNRGFVDLVVGDIEVADVMPLTDRTLYVLGKKVGTTNVSVYDGSKQLVGIIDVEVGYNTARIAADMDRISPGSAARVSSANGRTVLSGEMADAAATAKAVGLARQYGPDVVNDLVVRSPQQVMLEVRFVEASRNAGKELGINWRVVGKNFGSATSAALNFAAASGSGLPTGNAPFGASSGACCRAASRRTCSCRRSRNAGSPAASRSPTHHDVGREGELPRGGEFPIPVSSDGDRITIDYKKFGVSLAFTPTVLANGVINLRIEPEVSQLDYTNVVRTASVAVPALIVRRANTVVELRDGQSFAIAGLLQSINQETQESCPGSRRCRSSARCSGAAFERKETDLAIIVTPRLVKREAGQRLKTPLDNTAPANDVDLFLVGRQEVGVEKARLSGTAPLPPRGHILNIR